MRVPFSIFITGCLLLANTLFAFSRQDTLRGSNGNGRNWWDVTHYRLYVFLDEQQQEIAGSVSIDFTICGKIGDSMQIDLQEPLILDSAVAEGRQIPFAREGNVYWIHHPFAGARKGSEHSLKLFYHGKPKEARNAPWDGGFIWKQDEQGSAWIAVACQGTGASCWWPCKDIQSDEPQKGMNIILNIPAKLEAISNGRFVGRTRMADRQQVEWEVRAPINNYNITFYIGDYIHWSEDYAGLGGNLHLVFCALRGHEAAARLQFREVRRMLEAFEYWMGPYPFYEDGYKLVEAPFLGMEHQSAIAYGNKFQQGYLGKDRSNTGIGLLFDFIIVHESGHEWFGNSITAADIADNWIHEGFTTYSEALFTEYWFGTDKARTYTMGEWANIRNDVPVQGHPGVNDDGSGDKYDKASAMIHTVRELMHDDQKFRALLQALNKRYFRKVVSGKEVEQFLIQYSGLALQPVFDQYLRSTQIPVLEWKRKRKKLLLRFSNAVAGWKLPIGIQEEGKTIQELYIGTEWQECKLLSPISKLQLKHAFLIREVQVP